jgi:hypothetical protein
MSGFGEFLINGELIGRGERGGLCGLRVGLARHTEAGTRGSLYVLDGKGDDWSAHGDYSRRSRNAVRR